VWSQSSKGSTGNQHHHQQLLMKRKNMKLKKLGSTGNKAKEHNISCIGRATEMNMTNELQKRGCLMLERRLKTIGQGIQVKTYKEGDKITLWTVQIIHSNNKAQMSQINNNNYYTTAPTSPSPYITRKLNNMDKARMMKAERDDWTRTYHKILKELEAMIDMQR